MSNAIKGHKYYHYKSKSMIYTVIESDALDCETVKPFVIYRSEYDSTNHPKGTIWIRSKKDFESKVTCFDGTLVDRFTEI